MLTLPNLLTEEGRESHARSDFLPLTRDPNEEGDHPDCGPAH